MPSVDRLLSDERIRELEKTCSRSTLVGLVREGLEQARLSIGAGGPDPSFDQLVESIRSRARDLERPSLRPVINATGVILHTNLGRAPISGESVAAMVSVAEGYSNLEFDLGSGKRGSRHAHIERLLCQATGAEAALVVNNNASAVMLGLSALARRKEVIVSRGQEVEIGGGFRIPDVMRQSGAKLVEVGTTNRTRISDYEGAITPRTAGLLRVHASNFKIVGFTQEVSLGELVQLGSRYGIPVLDDLGSGCLLDPARFGLGPEPTVQESVAQGASLIFFSGDKLLGGPQAGIILGRKPLIDSLKKHPLARAVRIDKTGLAGLSATLIHYLKGEALEKIPVWRMISTPLEEIERRAGEWARALGGVAEPAQGESLIGGGSLPGSTLPTVLVALKAPGERKGPGAVQRLARELRSQEPAVIGRIQGNTLFLDPRTVLPEDDEALLGSLRRVFRPGGSGALADTG